MAASDGTKAGSAPEGVGVGTAVGVGESLADGVGDGDALGEGDALGVAVGAGRAITVGVHPPRTIAIVAVAQAWAIRRDRVPAGMLIGRVRSPGHAPRKPAKNVLPYAHGLWLTLTAKMRVRFESHSAPCSAGGARKPSGR